MQNRPVMAGGRATPNIPAISTNSELARGVARGEAALNKALARYVFRPCVQYSIGYDDWRGGMRPDDNSRWYSTYVTPGTKVSEAEAVIALVRLDLIGDLGRVRLCENCGARWFVRAKSSYRFCGAACREDFDTRRPDYHRRKAENQRAYRKRQKLEDVRAKERVQRVIHEH
jgi:hypothetical protein